MTKSKKILFRIFVVLVVAFAAFRWYQFFCGAASQPIEFSHKVHTEMLKCEECHLGVMNSASATLPNLKVCMGCHQGDPLSKSQEEIKLINFIKNNQEVGWKRLYKNPVHVYFSHNRHVSVGNIKCETCHGDMGKAVKPPGRALVHMDMDYCMSCHKKNKVDNSCVICHK